VEATEAPDGTYVNLKQGTRNPRFSSCLDYNKTRRIVDVFEAEECPVATEEEILEEQKKVRRLQIVMDLVISTLQQTEMPIEEASELVAATRRFALALFPDKGDTFDLIYRPRLQRVLAEKYNIM
jgi:hypothetical protein